MNRHLKLAVRHLMRRKVHALIILLSLVLGFLCTTILVSILVFEWSTDSAHPNVDRTYQIFSDDPFSADGQIAYTPSTLAPFLGDNYPEVERYCRIAASDVLMIKRGEENFSDLIIISADTSFFHVFAFDLIAGSYDLSPESIILDEQEAIRIFGVDNPIGQPLIVETPMAEKIMTVSGVIDSKTTQSHLRFHGLIHPEAFDPFPQGGLSYVLLASGIHPTDVARKLNQNTSRPGLIGEGKMQYSLRPLRQSYFSAENRVSFARTRSQSFIDITLAVAGIIFFMGSFNFGALFLLSIRERSKEAGITKTLGISFSEMLKTLIAEVGVYLLIAVPVSLSLAVFLIPKVNELLGTSMTTTSLWRIDVIMVITALILILGATISLLVAQAKWKTKSITLIQTNTGNRSIGSPLFYLQFVTSICIVICTITILKQIDFIREAPLGFNRQILEVRLPAGSPFEISVLKQEVMKIRGVHSATVASGNPISGNMVLRHELGDNEHYNAYFFTGDEDFLRTLDLKVIDGDPRSDGKLVNETFVRYFRLKDPVGEIIPGTNDHIAAVVADFTCSSFKSSIPPVIIALNNEGSRLLVDHRGSDHKKVVENIRALAKKLFPDLNPAFSVIQDDLMKKYKEDLYLHKIVVAASALSILISFFGLFAICWSTTQARTKEIGIRKVLGATAGNIARMLAMMFFKRITIAFIIAAPIGYYFSRQWLENFATRIDFSATIFLDTGMMVVFVTIVTLAFQIFRAALTNPAEELRRD